MRGLNRLVPKHVMKLWLKLYMSGDQTAWVSRVLTTLVNMWRYIESVKPPEPKKTKTKEEKRATQCVYDPTKRERTWQAGWETEFPWVIHDPGRKQINCQTCRHAYGHLSKKTLPDGRGRFAQYSQGPFVKGCDSYKHSALKDHHLSKGHRAAVTHVTSVDKNTGIAFCQLSLCVFQI